MGKIEKYMPTHVVYYILSVLKDREDVYSTVQAIEAMSHGRIVLGIGTVYYAMDELEIEGFIEQVGERNYQKLFSITEKGQEWLQQHDKDMKSI